MDATALLGAVWAGASPYEADPRPVVRAFAAAVLRRDAALSHAANVGEAREFTERVLDDTKAQIEAA